MHGLPVGTRPLRGNAAALARSHVPLLRVERGRPWAPWLRSVIDAEAALKPHALRMRAVRENLAPEISFQRGVVRHAAAIAVAAMRKDRAAPRDVVSPRRLTLGVEGDEILVGCLPGDLIFRHSCQNHSIGGFVGVVAIE